MKWHEAGELAAGPSNLPWPPPNARADFTHGNPRAFETDCLKEEYLELTLGLRVRRITDQRLHREPGAVAAVVRRALDGPRP